MTVRRGASEFWQDVTAIIDGTADETWYDSLAESDELRDLRHEVEELCTLLAEAGGDFVLAADFSQRVEQALLEAPTPSEPTEEDDAASDEEDQRESTSEEDGAGVTPDLGLTPSKAWRWLRQSPIRLGGSIAAVVVGTLLVIGRSETSSSVAGAGEPWSGKVAWVENATGKGDGLEVCRERGGCSIAVKSSRIASPSTLKTGASTRAKVELGDGSTLALERDSTLDLLEEPRTARLQRGTLAVDVSDAGDPSRIFLPHGRLAANGAKFSVEAYEGASSVDVSRGSVRLTDNDDHTVTVYAGESGRLEQGGEPKVTFSTNLGPRMVWSEPVRAERELLPSRGLGELSAKKPGDRHERDGAVELVKHTVKIRVSGAMARVEIDEVFQNNTDDTLEGIYRFPLPPGAKIERLALEVDGKLEEGAFVDRDRAAAIWRGSIVNAAPKLKHQIKDEIIWVPGPWKDPALLEWQRGGRFELRIFPIPKRGRRRVVLTYTEIIAKSGDMRRFNYPLPYDPSGSTKVADFAVDIEVRGHDPKLGVRAAGYKLEQRTREDRVQLAHAAKNFVPSGDLTLEYALPKRGAELSAWTYQVSSTESNPGLGERYAALSLSPRLPRLKERRERQVMLIVDRSRSMFGENFRRATLLASRLVEELDPEDGIGVMACDVQCNTIIAPGTRPTSEVASSVYDELSATTVDGGSNLVASIQAASKMLGAGEGSDRKIVYIGDGTPTVGAIRPGFVTRALEGSVGRTGGNVIGVPIGPDSDDSLLAAAARVTGGVVLPFAPGQTISETTYTVLGASYQPILRNIELELPDGLREVAPRRLDNLLAGGETYVVAKMDRAQVRGNVVIRGKLGAENFEQSYPLVMTINKSQANAFAPRLYAALRIADLERSSNTQARLDAVALSQRFNVASRHTSLLVLESPAMFRAFGLDNSRHAPEWTGEEQSEKDAEYSSEDQLELGDAKAAQGASGYGAASGATRSAPRKKASRSPRSRAQKPKAPAAAAPRSAPSMDAEDAFELVRPEPPFELPPPRRRPMVPMRKIWDRKARIDTENLISKAATSDTIYKAEQALNADENNRTRLMELYVLQTLAHRDEAAEALVERWSEKEPLDPDAMTKRADSASRKGERKRAIRILSGVVDVRPNDIKAQKRLARLYRWAGQDALGCAHSFAIAQLEPDQADLVADAVGCLRRGGRTELADLLYADQGSRARDKIDALLKAEASKPRLEGDFRIEANWRGGHDLDIAILHPDGHRVSWLGAPTRSIITATDVHSTEREGLALKGAKPGEYLVEVVRASGRGSVQGELELNVAGTRRTIPFDIDGPRATVARVTIYMKSRLVPL